MDLVLEGVGGGEILAGQRPVDAEHLLGISPCTGDGGEEIVERAAGAGGE